ncbi:Glycine-rich domain-containing protein 2 [Gracilariopsis chorda]|uniref:Glycine-rich domain-containing protein 2 n=1 Tax=Gracilariopsis chorda TaxID=448386 RepID=A0A2V3IKR5_9FLOR|nr:Glycine-rich domain-containing protein 2 [Gracilariopsis chorda]|eukprot:PXF42672.1 Glycine-rich domain-containing protein 2 [Gracilariopsis chorda]
MDSHILSNELQRMHRNLSHAMMEYLHATRSMTYMVKAVDLTYESMYEGPALQRSIWRYEALWLPLLAAISNPPTPDNDDPIKPQWSQHMFSTKVDEIRAKNFATGGLWLNSEIIVPPLDIAWVWHCHRLNPHAYAEDLARFARDQHLQTIAYITSACSTTITTAFKFSDGEDSQSRPTRRLWEIVYPYEAYMPKYLLNHTYAEEESRKRQHITSYTNEINRSTFRSVLGYDLSHAALLQKSFVYQIIDEDDPDKAELYETNPYLMRAFQRYLQFIVLHKSANNELLVPMKDINLIWHMHLSCTTEYTNDCNALIGYIVKHDSIAVEQTRRKEIEAMEAERAANGGNDTNLEDDEMRELREQRQRGISISRTKQLWEGTYGTKPRYDLPDTRYRGEPSGNRGGFKQIFEKTNGTSRDISWIEALLLMTLAIFVFFSGSVALVYAFYKTMVTHGKYLLGLPAGAGIMGLGVYIFLAIPISRPLSSSSRYWQDRAYKQTHNPLPPFLTATTKKSL